MAIVRIPTPLRKYTEGQDEVNIAGMTVAEVIANLEKKHPGIKARIYDDSGAVRKFVNLFVGEEDIRHLDNLATNVKDSDEISIIPAIAGGLA